MNINYILFEMANSKRQFLDPIGACCKLILLYFSPPGTKIRILNHTIELTDGNSYTEKVLWRPFYGDNRGEMCVLFPAIVRFIEIFLNGDDESKTNENESSDIDNDYGGFINTIKPISTNKKDENKNKSLKKIAEYTRKGIVRLQETYEFDNATFTLQYLSLLLKAGIDETYSRDLLPLNLLDITEKNLLDDIKIKQLWETSTIEHISDLFDKYFIAYEEKNIIMANTYRTIITDMLRIRDESFAKILNSTENL